MHIVIQCAASKHPDAKAFFAKDGRTVHFVARPEFAPKNTEILYARPDDLSDTKGKTWRQCLEAYVTERGLQNPYGLSQAYRLYRRKSYSNLTNRFGAKNVFILSAGWGLIRADFLTPTYDVTFNRRAKESNPMAFLPSTSGWHYFQQIPIQSREPVVFLGGRDYLPLFESLTEPLHGKRIVFERIEPRKKFDKGRPYKGMEMRPFAVAARTNWHYQCADALASGETVL